MMGRLYPKRSQMFLRNVSVELFYFTLFLLISEVSKIPKPNTFLSAQILSNLKRFPHCLLLTRVGNFYEVSTQ